MSPALQRSRPETCLSDLVLDRMVAGELPRPEHLATCEACAARLARLENDRESLPAQVWIAGEARKVKRRLPVAGLLVALSAAAAVSLVFTRAVEPPGERLKGGFALSLHARRGSGEVETILPGARLREGDAVRFSLSLKREGYVGVIGLDSAGEVTVHAAPEAPLPAGEDQLLEGSVVLDGTLGAERFVAVRCDHAPGVQRLVDAGRAALAAAGKDPRRVEVLRIDCEQAGFLVEKVK